MGASPGADRRAVTVLFADLAGFTTLAEQMDPEDVRALHTELFDAMRGALEPLGAFIEKFVGDAVVAVFGAQAHEDDPERAMRAALQMHGRMPELNTRWQRRLRSTLALHIGVNTGRVVAGKLGSDAQAREPQLLFPCYDGLATICLDRGDMAEAERYLVKAAEVSERAGLDRDSLVVLPFLC